MARHESIRIGLQNIAEAQQLFGQQDSFLRLIEDRFSARVLLRSDHLEVVGVPSATTAVGRLVDDLLGQIRGGHHLQLHDVKNAIRDARVHGDDSASTGKPKGLPAGRAASQSEDTVVGEALTVLSVHSKHGPIRPQSAAQANYVEAMRTHDLVFGIGPAGTGKTYLGMAMAASAMKSGLVDRIIMTRPAVEAGEKLGFLPGDIEAKVNPYLRPLYDALYDMFPVRTVEQYIEQGTIEIAPLAFMRGRTLNRSFVVLDEAQNATPAQMKMFLTRLGFDSKAVITGDMTQSDLPRNGTSGLEQAIEVLRRVDGIKFVEFSSQDVVRHELVQRIVDAYASYESQDGRSDDGAAPQRGTPLERA